MRLALSVIARLALATGAFAVLTGTTVALLPSCDGPPTKTCYADRVNAIPAGEDAGLQRACTACLQTKGAPNACCDLVGACDEDPTKMCGEGFRAAHSCLLEGGPSAESRCRDLLTTDLSKNLYSCMRASCGRECGIPSCDLDQAVVLIANPVCDTCVGGSCCEKINSCYESRRCKLGLECITTKCTATLGQAMSFLEASSPDDRKRIERAISPFPGDIRDDSAALEPLGSCLKECLDDFVPPAADGGTKDDGDARKLAFGVFACGADAHCGPKCVAADARP